MLNKISIGMVVLFTLLLMVQTSPVVAGELFVADLIDGVNSIPIPGNQAWPGGLGDDFTVDVNLTISKIGVFDDDGDGTSDVLFWALFDVSDGTLIHSQTVAASGPRTPGTTIYDNYIWADADINLTAGVTYSAVAYGFDSTDKNFNTNFNLGTLDVVFNTVGLTAYGGRYDYATDNGSLPNYDVGNSASTMPYNFGAASFQYTVPEPAMILMLGLGLGAVGLLSSRLRRK